MNNQEALAYIDRLWNKYGALYSDEKNAEHEEEAELMQKYFRALSIAKDAIKALEQEPTTKNDCISRSRAIERLKQNLPISDGADNSRDRYRYMQALADIQAIRELPSVTPQEPQSFEWCDTCKEYDQEKHCCHRWTKVIRNTVEEMKLGYERDVLDKVRAEILDCLKALDEIEKSGLNIYLPNEISGRRLTYQQCLEFIDKYKAETEDKE